MNEIKIDSGKFTEAESIVIRLLSSKKFYFSDLRPSNLPEKAGVYAIFDKETGENLYVGRTKNLRQRLYTQHLMGPIAGARLKKYFIEDPFMAEINDIVKAKQHLKDHCFFQYILEDDTRRRGQIEGMLGFFLDVKYIHEEH